METTTTFNLKTEALKNGAIWGIINIVLFLVVWYAVPSLMSSYWFAGFSFILGILLAVFFCLDLRKKAGGYWSFSQALWPILAMFIMSMAIVFVFTILFSKFIDPTYPVKMKELATANVEKMMRSMGADDSAIEEALSKSDEKFDKQFNPTFGEAIFQFGLSALFYFIGALIFALIFKKSNPNPFAPVNEEEVSTQ